MGYRHTGNSHLTKVAPQYDEVFEDRHLIQIIVTIGEKEIFPPIDNINMIQTKIDSNHTSMYNPPIDHGRHISIQ